MALNESKKSCIAWFKLAEFVDRKEKEKALVFYRLLSQSINNESFTRSLLGTIYKSFDEPEEAKKKLYLALEMFEELNLDAKIGIREFLIINYNNHQIEFIEALVQDYKKYYNDSKLIKLKIQELTKYIDQETIKIVKSCIGRV
jgi:hypothetical protein